MRRENRKNNKREVEEISKRKWFSVVGFLISITLLSIAIFLSINEENNERMAKIDNNATNLTRVASSEISRTINEVKEENSEKQTQVAEIGNNELFANYIKETSNSELENKNSETNTEKTSTGMSESEGENNNANVNANTNENGNQTQQTNAETQQVNSQESQNSSNQENSSQQFIKPVEGSIIKEYSMDSLIYSDTLQEWITHKGIDIKAEQSTPVKAVAAGTVKSIKNDPRYGQSITIEHADGFKTVYSCLLSTDFIHEGDSVEQGQQIGTVGNSGVFEVSDGSHLHFEMLKNDEYVNPDIYIK